MYSTGVPRTWRYRSSPEDTIEKFRKGIPDIIERAIGRSRLDTGHVLETNSKKFEAGGNYFVKMKSARLSCFVSTNDFSEDTNAVGAFASYVVAPMESVTQPLSPIAYAHNLAMFIEADVMEMPSDLMYFINKRYCLQDLGILDGHLHEQYGMSAALGNVDVYDSSPQGATGYAPLDRLQGDPIPDDAAFLDTIPNTFNTMRNERFIEMGSSKHILDSHLNRLGRAIAWVDKKEDYREERDAGRLDYEWDLILDALLDPKLELWASWLAGTLATGHACSTLQDFFDVISCLQGKVQEVLDEQGMPKEASFGATTAATMTFTSLREYLNDWQHHLQSFRGTLSSEQKEVLEVQGLSGEKGVEREKEYPVPYIFDRNIALYEKNSPLHPIEVNPYSQRSSLRYPSFQEEMDASRTVSEGKCMQNGDEGGSTAATIGAHRIF